MCIDYHNYLVLLTKWEKDKFDLADNFSSASEKELSDNLTK